MQKYPVPLTTGVPNNPDIPFALKLIEEVLQSNRLSNDGPKARQLENAFCEYLGVSEALLVSNASIGFDLVLSCLDLPKGAEIVTPSFTFPAFVHSMVRFGYTPVFCDIEKDYCISPRKVEKVLTKNTRLIVPANLFGNMCEPCEFFFDIPMVYDSAHAVGCIYNQCPDCDPDKVPYVGNAGLAEILSLHSTKMVGCGEGGVILTNDKDLAKKLRAYRNFGYYSGEMKYPQGKLEGFGTNAKMDELRAALGIVNFSNIEHIQSHLFDNHALYKELLPDLIKDKNCFFSNWSYVIAEIPSLRREKLLSDLYECNIYPRTYFSPLHLNPIYRNYYKTSLPNTERIAKEIIALPTGLAIGPPEIEFIVDSIKRSLNDR